MAKLNWQKVAATQQRERNQHQFNHHEQQKKLDRVWLLGKHYGKPLGQLPLEYLLWASKTLPDNTYHRLKADSELTKRYYKLKSNNGR